MRIPLGASLFGLAVLAVACGGGGGGSNVLPGPGTGGTTPSNTKTTTAAMVFKIPPANKQASRKPFYISAGTQSFGVLAVSVTSTATPNAMDLQVFPVTTPSPCATVSGGGLTCTLNVIAPIGSDYFYIGAFPTVTLSASSVPLSEFVAGPITVGASPSPGATPYTFSLNGVVYSVALTVASPDPGNTPNTQVFSVASPSAAEPLGITAYDSAGNVIAAQASTLFESPITISASPAAEGIGLALTSQCPSPAPAISRPRRKAQFGTGVPAIIITCAADLNNVTYGYDGTPHPDASDHIVDTFSFTASASAAPAATPASVVLASNLLTWQIAAGSPTGSDWESSYLTPMSNGQFLYLAGQYVNQTSSYNTIAGTFDPSTLTLSPFVTLNGVSDVYDGVAIASNGNLWVNDDFTGAYACYSSVAAALAGNAPVVSGLAPEGPASDSFDRLQPTGLVADSAGNIWWVGYDNQVAGQTYAGFFNSAATCVAAANSPIAQFTLTGDLYDYSPSLVPAGGGVAIQDSGNVPTGVYSMTTGTASGGVTPVHMNLATGYGGGLAVDANGTLYGTTADYGTVGNFESLASGASTFTTILTLPPTPQGSFSYPNPYFTEAFSPNGTGAADRAMYGDEDYGSLGLIEGLPASPMPLLVNLPNAYRLYQPMFSNQGAAYGTYYDQSNNLYLALVIPTTTWSVPNLQATALECSSNALLSIVERADSGPFTVTVAPATILSALLPGTDHDFFLNIPGTSTPFTAQVTDNHGRTETFAGTTNPANGQQCGIARRPSHHHGIHQTHP